MQSLCKEKLLYCAVSPVSASTRHNQLDLILQIIRLLTHQRLLATSITFASVSSVLGCQDRRQNDVSLLQIHYGKSSLSNHRGKHLIPIVQPLCRYQNRVDWTWLQWCINSQQSESKYPENNQPVHRIRCDLGTGTYATRRLSATWKFWFLDAKRVGTACCALPEQCQLIVRPTDLYI